MSDRIERVIADKKMRARAEKMAGVFLTEMGYGESDHIPVPKVRELVGAAILVFTLHGAELGEVRGR